MVRILCEGKTDIKFISSLLTHLRIEHSKENFYPMGNKSNFFKKTHMAYEDIGQLITIGEIEKLLFILDADDKKNDSKYGGHKNCSKQITQFIEKQGWSKLSDIFVICDPSTKKGYLESLILSTIPDQHKACIENFLDCSHFKSKDNHKAILNQIYKLGYPNHPYDFNHQNFSALKTKLQTLFTTED